MKLGKATPFVSVVHSAFTAFDSFSGRGSSRERVVKTRIPAPAPKWSALESYQQ